MPTSEQDAKVSLIAKNKKLAIPEYIAAVAASRNPDECVRAISMLHHLFYPEPMVFTFCKQKQGVLERSILRTLSSKRQPQHYAFSIKDLYYSNRSSFTDCNVKVILASANPRIVFNRIIAITDIIKKAKNPKEARILAERLQSCGNFIYYSGVLNAILAADDKEVFFELFNNLKHKVSASILQKIFHVRNAQLLVKISSIDKFVENIRMLSYIGEKYITEQNINALCMSANPEGVIIRSIVNFLELAPADVYIAKLEPLKDKLSLLLNDDILSLSVSSDNTSIELLALDILLKEKKEKEKAKDQTVVHAGESAERADLVRQERIVSVKLFSKYNSVLSNAPYNSNLELVEISIKQSILEEISANTASEEIKDFIIAHKSELAKGDVLELNARARELFSSKIDANHIAWRCYDKESPTRQYENLFVPQQQEKDIYSGVSKKITIATASDIVRKKTALYYLAAIDESTEELKSGKADRLKKFIYSLAEIRRGNNTEGDDDTIDTPSCYPGTLTRLAASVKCHPLFYTKENPEIVIRNIIKAEVTYELDKIINNSAVSPETKIKYFCAFSLIGLSNAQNIILGIEDFSGLDLFDFEFNTHQALKLRATLLSKIDFCEVLDKVTTRLFESHIDIQPEKVYYSCIKSLLDIKALGITLTSRQIQRIYPGPVSVSEPLRVIPSRRSSTVSMTDVGAEVVPVAALRA